MTFDYDSFAPRNQQTIAGPVIVEGYGYWSGRDIRVEFRPAEPNAGIAFVRDDLGPTARIPALLKHRVESPRRTTLRVGTASVEMIEHIMSALHGLRVDNCTVGVTAAEMPGCDGSSMAFVEAILKAGIAPQSAPVSRLVVTETIRVGDENSWVEARPVVSRRPDMSVKFRIDYGRENCIGRQTCQFTITPDVYRCQVAPARTFVLKEEADWLRAQGLAQRPTAKDLLIFDDTGPMDNVLRFEDECVRHKALDLVGDLALVGCPVVGQFTAHCSGHRLNAEMAKALLMEGRISSPARRSA